MAVRVNVHYDNAHGFQPPHLYVQYAGSEAPDLFAPTGADGFGVVYDVPVRRSRFRFKFKEGPGLGGRWEGLALDRYFQPARASRRAARLNEVWCVAEKPFVYPVEPRAPETLPAPEFLRQLPCKPGVYVPGSGGFSGLGAAVLADGRVLFGHYHPNAARVYVMGSFNDWQRPGHEAPDPGQFIELRRYRGYFDYPNTWLVVTDRARAGDEYKFFVQGGVPRDHKNRFQQYVTDPYARRLGPDFGVNNAVVVDPTTYQWGDGGWLTPDMRELILYELSVSGFTEGDPDISPQDRGTFRGITERIRTGYFSTLGVTALALMPLHEVPSMQGPQSLGYDPSLFFTVERDFGAPDDLRRMVDSAHQQGLAVILDQVFNHTSSSFNPLWQMILEHPLEEGAPGEGGLYFSGSTDWGNRVATEKTDVQSMLIDACKLMITEYHVDGFRFDATHSRWMDHGFLHRLATELRGFKPDTLLIAENLPNEPDLNRQGWNGFAQWSDPFHDKLKALLREGPFAGDLDTPEGLGEIFYFSKPRFALHTNNVVNYSESHDETSIPFEVATNPLLSHPAAKERKGRLGLFAALVALGQPMIYMGQEFNVERDRNRVSFQWPSPPDRSGFWQWAHRLIQFRRRYPGLKLSGDDPAGAGQFTWIVTPWMDTRHGGGRKVIGWRTQPSFAWSDTLVVMLSFDNQPVQVDLELGLPGTWVKLADIDRVDDIPPGGSNGAQDPTALRTHDGRFAGFTLPSSSGFIYKWEAP